MRSRLPLLRFAFLLSLPAVYHNSALGQRSQSAMKAVESLRIRGADHDLSIVPWVVGFPDGRIAVGGLPKDGAARWFGTDGRFLGKVGRSGEGPGEFRTAQPAGRLGDTLWVIDQTLLRATLVKSDELKTPFLATLRLANRVEPSGPQGFPVIGAFSAVLPGRRFLFEGIEMHPGAGDPSSAPLRLVTTDSTGRMLDAFPPMDPGGRCQVSYVSGKRKGSVGIPFCTQPILRVAQTGDRVAIVVTDNSSATQSTITVRMFSPEARLQYERVLRVPARQIPKIIADSIYRVALERAKSPEERAARSRAKLPPAYPPVNDVVVSDEGYLWLGTSGATETRNWIVLDPKGVRQADVLLAKEFRPVAVIGRDILGIEVDPDEFIDIVRYRVGG